MIAVARLLGIAVVVFAAWPAEARFVWIPAERIEEVPVGRLLANLERDARRTPAKANWWQIGRLHLIAYIRDSELVPVYRDRPDTVAEGVIGDCVEMDKRSEGFPSGAARPRRKPGELCEERRLGLEWYRLIQAEAHAASRRASSHLAASIEAFTRIKSGGAESFRTRLSLAFALDRAMRLEEARVELRVIVHWGIRRTAPLPGYQRDTLDWDAYAVLTEAAEHLALIPADGADRQDARTLKTRLGASQPPRMVTPILVPLKDGASFADLIDIRSSVMFDFTGQGPAERMGWLTPDAAWLVWDPKRRGRIVSGFQLFGSVSWMTFWENGYHALGSLDDDGDGKIAGRELDGLALWRDRNSNGVSERGEAKPVTAYGIVALSYAHQRARDDLWLSAAGVTFTNGEVRPTYDWVVRPAPVVVAGGERPLLWVGYAGGDVRRAASSATTIIR